MKSSSGVFLVKKKRQILAKLKHFTNCFDLPSFSSGEKRQKKYIFFQHFQNERLWAFSLWSNSSFWVIWANFLSRAEVKANRLFQPTLNELFFFSPPNFFSESPANRKISYSPSFLYPVPTATSEHPGDCLRSAAAAEAPLWMWGNYWAPQGCVRWETLSKRLFFLPWAKEEAAL